MDFVVENSWQSWHLIILVPVSFVCGIVGHIWRALFNYLPDRISDSHRLDMAISDGYSIWDWYYRVEYDVNGYYELDSIRNLNLAIILSVLCMVGSWFVIPGYADLIGTLINLSSEFLSERFASSIEFYFF